VSVKRFIRLEQSNDDLLQEDTYRLLLEDFVTVGWQPIPLAQISKEEFERRDRPFSRQRYEEMLEALERAEKEAQQRARDLAEQNKREAAELEEAAQIARQARLDADLLSMHQAHEAAAFARSLLAASGARATQAMIRHSLTQARALQALQEDHEEEEAVIRLLLH
jgi:hypothetical protein